MQTATIFTLAAVAGTAFSAAPEPTHAVKGKAGAAPAAAEARTVTVTTTIARNGASSNVLSMAGAALAGTLAFASFM
ncbi:hypothetical protein H4S07_001610 [Coemansia furcata]|uniref:Uncharacterized protein n=1 Tax=Coemansia furcata TaxID=417177 RepID=A0ACC1LLZ8_9FUNG|nr:hypothetical protein H4S07_001610 [Coemansia furcata]